MYLVSTFTSNREKSDVSGFSLTGKIDMLCILCLLLLRIDRSQMFLDTSEYPRP